MNINFKECICTFDFLSKKLNHLSDEEQGIISEDLWINHLGYDEALNKYNLDLVPKCLSDVNFLPLASGNPEDKDFTRKLRESFFNGIELKFDSVKMEDLFLSVFLNLVVNLKKTKELSLIFPTDKDVSLKFIFTTACNLYLQNNSLYNQKEFGLMIISFYGQLIGSEFKEPLNKESIEIMRKVVLSNKQIK